MKVKLIAVAVLLATLAGCAVVPVGPPVYVGARYDAHYGPYYGGPYYRRW